MTLVVVYTEDAADDIGRAEIHLRRNPAIYHVVRTARTGDIRRVSLRPFRYQLYFQILASEVVVIACLHSSRSPESHARTLASRS